MIAPYLEMLISRVQNSFGGLLFLFFTGLAFFLSVSGVQSSLR